MADVNVEQLQNEYLCIARTLLAEGYLGNQFRVLQRETDETNDPSFAVEVLNNFLTASETGFENIAKALEDSSQEEVDFDQLSIYAHQIKENSSRIGACRIFNLCVDFQTYCQEKQFCRCLRCVPAFRNEIPTLNEKIKRIIQLELDIVAAGGRVPSLS